MLFALAGLLVALWLLGFLVLRVAGGWVHLALAAALVCVLVGLLPHRPRV